MTQAEQIILTTRKKRKRQLIFKITSAIYTIMITTLLLYIIIHTGFPIPANTDNTNLTPSPTPEQNTSDISDDTLNLDVLDKNGKFVALTYDDGPSKYTSYLLDTLEEHGAKATFFIIGNRVENFRDTVKRMDALNMEISSHTFGHDVLTKLDEAGIKDTLDKTDDALTKIIGHGADLMRPVEGALDETSQAFITKPIIRWNVDTLDWKNQDTQAIVDHVLENVTDGCVILMHDIYPTTIEASKILIPKLQEMGYQLVTIPELAEVRGVELKSGEVYRTFPKTEQ